MFSTREVPWMKLGALADRPRTAKEAAVEGGLDFQVQLNPCGWRAPDGTWHEVPDRLVSVRGDTNEALGVVSPQYQPLQYAEAFEFLDSVNPEYVAAGALKGGRQAFMVVQVPEHSHLRVLDGVDPHDLYVILRTSHDGSHGVEVLLMALREKCMNQLGLQSFSAGAQQRWCLRHRRNLPGRLDEARSVLNGLASYATAFEETASRLAAVELSLTQARDVLDSYVVPEDRKRREDVITQILNLQNSPTNGFPNTGWGLLNAVSEYHDWYRGGANRREDARFRAGLDGSTHKAINRTAAVLLARFT